MLGQLCQVHGGLIVYGFREPRIVVTQRIIRQGSQVNDCVESFDIIKSYVANVFSDVWYVGQLSDEGAVTKKIGVESCDIVPG